MQTSYTTIAKFYDYIFPMNPNKIEFIRSFVGLPPKKILDVACGSGGDAIALSRMGYEVTAIDLDPIMIERLKLKDVSIDARVMNMLAIDELQDSYDLIYCVGNSLVHLSSFEEIEYFISLAHKLLNENGILIIQIVNYHRIFTQNIKQLPTIQNEEQGLTFERYYEFREGNSQINFRTILSVDHERYENSVLLLPISHDELVKLLQKIGFKHIQAFGSFNKDPFDPDGSFPLIIRASLQNHKSNIREY